MSKIETAAMQLGSLMFAARILGNIEIYDACKQAIEALSEAQTELNELREKKGENNVTSIH